MRTKSLLCVCLGIASIIFVGCNNTLDEVYYSCNKEADKWAKENIVDIQKMTRTDWERISDYSYQKAAYNAFTAEQKSTFWIERIEEIMLLDWNEDEINHLTDLLQFVKNHVSVFENDSDTKEADIYSYKWIDYARNNLNWTDYTIYAVTMSGYKMIDKSGTLMSQNNLKRTRSRKERECDCSRKFEFCGIGVPLECLPNENETRCTITIRGCDWLFLGECNGICDFETF